MMQLPPKRFQYPGASVYDPIRHKPWFGRLDRRRTKLRMMMLAKSFIDEGMTQVEACRQTNTEPREVRDYLKFVRNEPRTISHEEQRVLDDAYRIYCAREGEDNFQRCIHDAASLWGLKGRRVEELWEVAPGFYPRGYNLV